MTLKLRIKRYFKRLFCRHTWRPIMGSSKLGGSQFIRCMDCYHCGKRTHSRRKMNRFIKTVNKGEAGEYE